MAKVFPELTYRKEMYASGVWSDVSFGLAMNAIQVMEDHVRLSDEDEGLVRYVPIDPPPPVPRKTTYRVEVWDGSRWDIRETGRGIRKAMKACGELDSDGFDARIAPEEKD